MLQKRRLTFAAIRADHNRPAECIALAVLRLRRLRRDVALISIVVRN